MITLDSDTQLPRDSARQFVATMAHPLNRPRFGGPPEAPRVVVCAVIENGGEGGKAAAPAAERVFARFFNVPVPPTAAPIHSDCCSSTRDHNEQDSAGSAKRRSYWPSSAPSTGSCCSALRR